MSHGRNAKQRCRAAARRNSDRWPTSSAAASPGDGLAASLGWVARTIDVSSLLAEVRESTRRVSELVAGRRWSSGSIPTSFAALCFSEM